MKSQNTAGDCAVESCCLSQWGVRQWNKCGETLLLCLDAETALQWQMLTLAYIVQNYELFNQTYVCGVYFG